MPRTRFHHAAWIPSIPVLPLLLAFIAAPLLAAQTAAPPAPAVSTANPKPTPTSPSPDAKPASTPPPQPKRVLGLMPNFRSVSAGVKPPPPTAKQSFRIATQNSFDYSAFIFVGITSAFAKMTDAHPQLGEGVNGYAQYYWRGYVDKTDGNYMVDFVFPTLLHEDERYYALGQGGIWKRAWYSASRILITPNYQGQDTFNAAELLGRGMAEAISTTYYPQKEDTVNEVATMYSYAVGRDAFTNVFYEFWPDIAVHVLHMQHP